ncbi:hypothetical protein evm_006170 [Chilo suppressalis]|nr:hypothetical protein evm_006170 [Chilo suppressalis]
MEYFKVLWIFLLLKIYCAHTFQTGCSLKLNEEECLLKVYCLNMTEDNVDYYNRHNFNSHMNCPFYQSPHTGYQYYMVDMKFQGDAEGDGIFTIPNPTYYNCFICPMIYKLDLSSNSYTSSPTLSAMKNLAYLSLSRNSLTVAKLSNRYELAKLISLDLSYNTISEIDVEYESYTELQILNISNNYIVTIPDAIFDNFPQLLTLDLSHNFIDVLGVATFEGLKKLSTLIISHNRLSEIKESLFRFSQLKILDLSNNRLEHIKSRDFDKLQGLTHLNLSDNSIATIENTVFNSMGSLQFLQLSNNSLQDLSKVNFSNAINLVYVDFSRNELKSLPKELFKGNNLTFFNIEGNNLEGTLIKGTFKGLKRVPKLDLSNQQLTAIEDYAFLGLEAITYLKLNKNKLQSLSLNSFKNLVTLTTLDLSDNRIVDLNFDSTDLINLHVISLENNFISEIEPEYFEGLSSLHFLHLSNNNLPKLDSISFNSLHELIYFDISGNPLNGTLETDTFNGLNSLPLLDISFTQLEIVKNGSFKGLEKLKKLNMSHSAIKHIEYNSFTLLSTVETIDLSFNQIRTLEINGTDLVNLKKLLLSHNLLKFITSNVFLGLSSLTEIDLSYNDIKVLRNDVFENQGNLEYLDMSFNSDVAFDVSIISHNKHLYYLHLSGLKCEINFTSVDENLLFELHLTYTTIKNITYLDLQKLTALRILILSHNIIEKVEQGSFSNMNVLERIDLSYNKIMFLQPGVFTDNTYLHTLNISHNFLTTVAYGVLNGLLYLNTLDISYNRITNLESERFNEVQSLQVIIADYNRIDYLNVKEFSGTNLRELSIGGNLVPCKVLAKLKENDESYKITAIHSHDYSKANIRGITCINEIPVQNQYNKSNINDYSEILTDIRDTLHVMVNKNITQGEFVRNTNNTQFFHNFTQAFEGLTNDYENKLTSFINQSSLVNKEKLNTLNEILQKSVNKTNSLLEKILKALSETNSVTIPTQATKDKNSIDFIRYINNVKSEMTDVILAEKRNILNEMERKINAAVSRNLTVLTPPINKEKLVSKNKDVESRPTLFTDICVSIILLILVCLILYKFYKSRMFVRARRSYSTRELPSAMESPDL